VLAKTGSVVTQAPSKKATVISHQFSAGKESCVKIPPASALRTFLSADGRGGLHLRVTTNRSSHTSAVGHADSLSEQTLFERREEQQHKWFLAAVAHQSNAPDLALHRAEASGDFDVELVEQLIAHFHVVNAAGDHHGCDRWQAVRRVLHQQIQPHRFDARDQCELIY